MKITRFLLLVLLTACSLQGKAQKPNFSYRFYGQVRGDLFYNSRANAEIVDGLFHLYPKDRLPDADGQDLNAVLVVANVQMDALSHAKVVRKDPEPRYDF